MVTPPVSPSIVTILKALTPHNAIPRTIMPDITSADASMLPRVETKVRTATWTVKAKV